MISEADMPRQVMFRGKVVMKVVFKQEDLLHRRVDFVD